MKNRKNSNKSHQSSGKVDSKKYTKETKILSFEKNENIPKLNEKWVNEKLQFFKEIDDYQLSFEESASPKKLNSTIYPNNSIVFNQLNHTESIDTTLKDQSCMMPRLQNTMSQELTDSYFNRSKPSGIPAFVLSKKRAPKNKPQKKLSPNNSLLDISIIKPKSANNLFDTPLQKYSQKTIMETPLNPKRNKENISVQFEQFSFLEQSQIPSSNQTLLQSTLTNKNRIYTKNKVSSSSYTPFSSQSKLNTHEEERSFIDRSSQNNYVVKLSPKQENSNGESKNIWLIERSTVNKSVTKRAPLKQESSSYEGEQESSEEKSIINESSLNETVVKLEEQEYEEDDKDIISRSSRKSSSQNKSVTKKVSLKQESSSSEEEEEQESSEESQGDRTSKNNSTRRSSQKTKRVSLKKAIECSSSEDRDSECLEHTRCENSSLICSINESVLKKVLNFSEFSKSKDLGNKTKTANEDESIVNKYFEKMFKETDIVLEKNEEDSFIGEFVQRVQSSQDIVLKRNEEDSLVISFFNKMANQSQKDIVLEKNEEDSFIEEFIQRVQSSQDIVLKRNEEDSLVISFFDKMANQTENNLVLDEKDSSLIEILKNNLYDQN